MRSAIRSRWSANTRCAAASSTYFLRKPQQPVRIEFFGDLIESMRRFDVESQRSVLQIKEATLLPLLEYPKSRRTVPRARGACRRARRGCRERSFRAGSTGCRWRGPRRGSILSLAQDAIVVWDEWEQIAGAAERLWKRLLAPEKPTSYPPEKGFFTWEELRGRSRGRALGDIPGTGSDHRPASAAVAYLHAPVDDFSRQYSGRGVRSPVDRRKWRASGRSSRLPTANSSGSSDILSEYKVPFQLGHRYQRDHRSISRRARVSGGNGSQHISDQRAGANAASLSRIRR